MKVFYLFNANKEIDRQLFAARLQESQIPLEIAYHDPRRGYILSDERLSLFLNQKAMSIHYDLGAAITFLACHKEDDLERKLLPEALAYYPNQLVYLSDVMLKQFSYGNFASLFLLSKEFRGVDPLLMETVGTYLRTGMNALQTAELLFVHRNTVNNRIAEFIEATSLDIRDYHNALLLEIYFQFDPSSRNSI